jgi:hypothetical protein
VYDTPPGSKSGFAAHTKMINLVQKLYVIHKKGSSTAKSICNFFPYVTKNVNFFVFSRNSYRLNANLISVLYIFMSLVTFYTINAKLLNFQGYQAPNAKERVCKRGTKTAVRTEQKSVVLDAELIYRFTPPHSDSETTLVMDFTCGTGKNTALIITVN